MSSNTRVRKHKSQIEIPQTVESEPTAVPQVAPHRKNKVLNTNTALVKMKLQMIVDALNNYEGSDEKTIKQNIGYAIKHLNESIEILSA